MKLQELTDFDISNGKQFGYGEGGTRIIKSVASLDPRMILFSLYTKKENQLLTGVAGYFFKFDDITYFKIQDVFTSEPFRQQGYATALYVALARKYGVKLMSDTSQSSKGKRLWQGISKQLTISVLDVQKSIIVPKTQVSDAEIYDT